MNLPLHAAILLSLALPLSLHAQEESTPPDSRDRLAEIIRQLASETQKTGPAITTNITIEGDADPSSNETLKEAIALVSEPIELNPESLRKLNILPDSFWDHPYLGIAVAPTPASAEETQPTSNSGLKIITIEPRSPAASSPLKVGDILTQLDGEPLTTPSNLITNVQSRKVGDKLAFAYLRDGETHETSIELVKRDGIGINAFIIKEENEIEIPSDALRTFIKRIELKPDQSDHEKPQPPPAGPSHADIERLNQSIDSLSQKIDELIKVLTK